VSRARPSGRNPASGRRNRPGRLVNDGEPARPGPSADSATPRPSVSAPDGKTPARAGAGKTDASPEWVRAVLRAMANYTSIIPRSAAKESTRPGRAPVEPSWIEALLARASDRDARFRAHALRVAALSVRVGTALGLRPAELETLELAAKLHDVGKLAVSARILAKPGPLDDDEWAAMRRHPAEGARLLATYVSSTEVLAIVRSHHERWDGAGYPEGLHAEQIPLGARIVAVVDAFCAMTEPRPYRPCLDDRAARSELVAQAGRQFDPACAEAAHRLTGTS
jgi:HD-GYP domain-containing protein (c-di-GMP phosphodiesterase class II)